MKAGEGTIVAHRSVIRKNKPRDLLCSIIAYLIRLNRTCENEGVCIRPDVCECTAGFYGATCSDKCTCENGKCVDGQYTYIRASMVSVLY